MLEVLGLDPNAERVYEVLIAGRPADLAGLSADCGVSGADLDRAVRRLESLGLVTRAERDPDRYTVVDPGIALDLLLLERAEQLKLAQVRVQEFNERFRIAAARQDPAELVEIVTGPSRIKQRVAQVERGARSRLRCLDKPPYAGDPTAVNPVEREFLARGGVAQAIYERASLEVPGRFGQIELMALSGEQAKLLPTVPAKLLLVDDRVAVIPLQAAPEEIDSMVFVHRSAMLEGLSALFDMLWEFALPLRLHQAGGEPAADRPTAEEQRLLALLTSGMPDAGIGRQLGLSHRTLQRRIQALMRRLHAQSRFQLALQAVAHRWLDPAVPAGPGQP